jgi:outer membrane lipoprotein-sorting protein
MKWKYCYVRYDSGIGATLTVNAKVDNATDFMNQQSISMQGTSPGLGPTGTFTLGVSTLGGNTTTTNRVILKQLTGKLLQMEFTESSTNAVTIHDWEIYALQKGLRGN